MGLGKTVMTIALILARLDRGSSLDDQEFVSDDADETEYITKRLIDTDTEVSRKAKGGTLIVCPMALLGQWKVIGIITFFGALKNNSRKMCMFSILGINIHIIYTISVICFLYLG